MADRLMQRARRSYELARLRMALPWALPALALAATALAAGSTTSWPVVGLLAVALVGARWRGGGIGRGAVAGLGAGLLAFVTPLAWELLRGGCCTTAALSVCWPTCLLGGAATALVLGAQLRRHGEEPGFLLAAASTTALTAALGCLPLGALGLAGVAVALLPAPFVWLAPPRSTA